MYFSRGLFRHLRTIVMVKKTWGTGTNNRGENDYGCVYTTVYVFVSVHKWEYTYVRVR